MKTYECIKTWRRNGFTLRLYYTGKRSGYGHEVLSYQFKDRHVTIFTGDDFGCSPMHGIDSIDTVYGLLGFLSVREHDTDAEYFKGYTPEQIAWRDSDRCDELALMVYDHETRKSD